jgi:hypothetical protein
MKVEDTERALLDVVDGTYRRQVEAILGEAEERSRVILQEAHERVGRGVRIAYLEARERAEERIVMLRARVATAGRLHEQRRAAEILEAEWALLPDALAKRWGSADARRSWALHAARAALGHLPRHGWSIEHPADWAKSEQTELAAQLAPELTSAPTFAIDASVRVGLRIKAGHNVVDATLDGLLADREAIGARLLSLTKRNLT